MLLLYWIALYCTDVPVIMSILYKKSGVTQVTTDPLTPLSSRLRLLQGTGFPEHVPANWLGLATVCEYRQAEVNFLFSGRFFWRARCLFDCFCLFWVDRLGHMRQQRSKKASKCIGKVE